MEVEKRWIQSTQLGSPKIRFIKKKKNPARLWDELAREERGNVPECGTPKPKKGEFSMEREWETVPSVALRSDYCR